MLCSADKEIQKISDILELSGIWTLNLLKTFPGADIKLLGFE